jgi:hypothetical protein
MKRNRYLAVVATLVLGATTLAFGEVEGWVKQTPSNSQSTASCCPGCCEAAMTAQKIAQPDYSKNSPKSFSSYGR